MDAKLSRLKELILQREEIDAELETLLSGGAPRKRMGRPPKPKEDEVPNFLPTP